MARTTTRRRTSRRNPARSTGMLVVNPRRRRRNTRRKSSYFKTPASRRRAMRGMYAPKRRRTNRKRRTNRRRTTRTGMVRRTARRAYRPKRRTNRRRTVARRRRNTRHRRNPSMKASIAKIPFIGKPLSMMWSFGPAALIGAISVEPTMMLARLLGPMLGGNVPASLFYAVTGLALATIVQYLPIADKNFREKLSVAVASAAGGVAFYKWRTGMDTSVSQEVGLLELHGAGTGFGALELFPGPLNGAMGALELYPGPLNGYGDGMAYTVNPYPGTISNGSY